MAPATPTKISDYTILPLNLLAIPSFPQQATHYLYLRPHAPKVPDADTPRSLFLVNLPIDATDSSIRTLFTSQLSGTRVERVEFESGASKRGIGALSNLVGRKRKRGQDDLEGAEVLELPKTWDRTLLKSGSSAVVVFVDKASAEMAMKAVQKAAKSRKGVEWKRDGGSGVARYNTHHHLRYPPTSALQTSINAYLSAFTSLESSLSAQKARQRTVPDAEGFITVTRGGRVGPARLEQAQAKKAELEERDKKRVGEDFYRFQMREKRKEGERELKRRFEEDRRRLERVRQGRKVRPES